MIWAESKLRGNIKKLGTKQKKTQVTIAIDITFFTKRGKSLFVAKSKPQTKTTLENLI